MYVFGMFYFCREVCQALWEYKRTDIDILFRQIEFLVYFQLQVARVFAFTVGVVYGSMKLSYLKVLLLQAHSVRFYIYIFQILSCSLSQGLSFSIFHNLFCL